MWGTHAEVWARVEFVKKGKRGEQREAQKTGTITEVNVTTRFLSTVTTKMRIVWNSQAWDIHGIRPNERKNYMEIEATEVK